VSAAEPLYRALLAAWNADDAEAFAAPFASGGVVVGFDGSEMRGRAEIAAAIDLYHNTPAAWHGRPDDQAALSEELRGLLPLDRD
jgi:uncharacterized protein (TIGR02246 family)